jgi:hypothetical protein
MNKLDEKSQDTAKFCIVKPEDNVTMKMYIMNHKKTLPSSALLLLLILLLSSSSSSSSSSSISYRKLAC